MENFSKFIKLFTHEISWQSLCTFDKEAKKLQDVIVNNKKLKRFGTKSHSLVLLISSDFN